jgi:hypothetical protein
MVQMGEKFLAPSLFFPDDLTLKLFRTSSAQHIGDEKLCKVMIIPFSLVRSSKKKSLRAELARWKRRDSNDGARSEKNCYANRAELMKYSLRSILPLLSLFIIIKI